MSKNLESYIYMYIFLFLLFWIYKLITLFNKYTFFFIMYLQTGTGDFLVSLNLAVRKAWRKVKLWVMVFVGAIVMWGIAWHGGWCARATFWHLVTNSPGLGDLDWETWIGGTRVTWPGHRGANIWVTGERGNTWRIPLFYHNCRKNLHSFWGI